ncbi:MAG: hypothetical protein IPF75_15530 [Bacteroidetes bacterium]|nr:hypothetical protein [Bacteroidota bacterium]
MATQPTVLPKLYIGMDIHKKVGLYIFGQIYQITKQLQFLPAMTFFIITFKLIFRSMKCHWFYEAGCCGFTASRYFLNLGWNVLVVNPADVPRTDKQSHQKTDVLDCRNLAKQLPVRSFARNLYSGSKTRLFEKFRYGNEQKLLGNSAR